MCKFILASILTKKLHGLHKMTYSDRFILLGIESLYCRRVKADLLICYSILTNRLCLASSDFFTLSVTTSISRKTNDRY